MGRRQFGWDEGFCQSIIAYQLLYYCVGNHSTYIRENVTGVFHWGYLICRKPTYYLFQHIGFQWGDSDLLGSSAIDVIRERSLPFNFSGPINVLGLYSRRSNAIDRNTVRIARTPASNANGLGREGQGKDHCQGLWHLIHDDSAAVLIEAVA